MRKNFQISLGATKTYHEKRTKSAVLKFMRLKSLTSKIKFYLAVI